MSCSWYALVFFFVLRDLVYFLRCAAHIARLDRPRSPPDVHCSPLLRARYARYPSEIPCCQPGWRRSAQRARFLCALLPPWHQIRMFWLFDYFCGTQVLFVFILLLLVLVPKQAHPYPSSALPVPAVERDIHRLGLPGVPTVTWFRWPGGLRTPERFRSFSDFGVLARRLQFS